MINAIFLQDIIIPITQHFKLIDVQFLASSQKLPFNLVNFESTSVMLLRINKIIT